MAASINPQVSNQYPRLNSFIEKVGVYAYPNKNDVSRIIVLSGVAAFSAITPYAILPYLITAHITDLVVRALVPYVINVSPINSNLIREYTLLGIIGTGLIATGVEIAGFSTLTGYVPIIEVVCTVVAEMLNKSFP